MIALPIALAVLIFMFGTVGGISVPLLFALASIPTTLGFVWIFAHFLDMAIYVQNIVTLIGFAIAIDYSMLVVFRYREELQVHADEREALLVTMSTAGRATVFSGVTVAIASAINCGTLTGPIVRRSLPEMMRETSRISSTICVSVAPLRSMTSSAAGWRSGGTTPVRSMRA